MLYAGLSGLWGVVATDFFQFFLALFGAVLVAAFAISSPEVGGLSGLVQKSQAFTDFDILAFTPLTFELGQTSWWGVGWSAVAGISTTSFMAHVMLQWWTFRRSDGGGEFIQRLAASKDEASAEKAAWLFNIMHYIVRTWPWVLVALAAVVLYPDLEDPELGYPRLMLDFLPAGLLGVVVASLVAAFMSTVSTQINWGASYLTNDIYQRFFRPEAPQAELVAFGRIASVLITVFGATAAFYSESVQWIFQLVIAVGTGPGRGTDSALVLVADQRLVRACRHGGGHGYRAPHDARSGRRDAVVFRLDGRHPDPGVRLRRAAHGDHGCDDGDLGAGDVPDAAGSRRKRAAGSNRLARPGGPGWMEEREATGLAPIQSLRESLIRASAAVLVLYGLMFGIGAFLLLRPLLGIGLLAVASVGGAVLYRYYRRNRAVGIANGGSRTEN